MPEGLKWTMLLFFVFLAACGSPYTHTTTQQEIQASASEFSAILDYCLGHFDIIDEDTEHCSCPRGGDIVLDTGTGSMTVNNCTSVNNDIFDGSLVRNSDNSLNIHMDTFGRCYNVTGSGVGIDPDTSCGGALRMICANLGQTCTYSDAAAGSDRCTVTCVADRT